MTVPIGGWVPWGRKNSSDLSRSFPYGSTRTKIDNPRLCKFEKVYSNHAKEQCTFEDASTSHTFGSILYIYSTVLCHHAQVLYRRSCRGGNASGNDLAAFMRTRFPSMTKQVDDVGSFTTAGTLQARATLVGTAGFYHRVQWTCWRGASAMAVTVPVWCVFL